jgi:dTMP kinase
MGYFVIEGCDGSGKTTQIRAIEEIFRNSGVQCVTTKEPGGTNWGSKLRQLMLNEGTDDEIALALAMFSDRVQMMKDVVKPALTAKKVVISDRSYYSTLAYQGISPLRFETIQYIRNALSPFIVEPDLVFLLDVPIDVAMSYSRKIDVFERSGTGFYNGVRTRYLEIAEQNTEKFIVIDGMQPEKNITEQIAAKIFAFEY